MFYYAVGIAEGDSVKFGNKEQCRWIYLQMEIENRDCKKYTVWFPIGYRHPGFS